YQNRSLKSWEARQELLSVVFRGYNFSKNSEKEKEDEAIEQLRLRIDDLILAGQLAVASGDWLKGL
ncbi:hypothetical protein KJ912_01830, partial [Patescibacteria group bacterium]|nr:hypothetical protein [Patescibacteria group bacterium]